MTWVLLLTFVLFAAAGCLMLWLARASKQRRLPRNQFAGLRTRVTLTCDEAWYVAQERTALHVQVSGHSFLVTAGATFILVFMPLNDDQTAATFAVLSLGTSIWVLLWLTVGSFKGNKAALEVIQTEEKQAQ